jgi:hypothetical protein
VSKASLKSYRKEVGDAWLPLVGRRRLTSHEYKFIQQLFESSIQPDLVLKAIKRCFDRARRAGNTLYSLGVIKNDLETIMAQKSQANVGAGRHDPNAWRGQWRRDLEDLIGMVDEPFLGEYKALLADLDSLSADEAFACWQAIQKL